MTDDRLLEIVAGIAQLSGEIKTLNATVEAHMDRTGDEIKALFAKSRENAGKIEAIWVDYVPKDDCAAKEKQSRLTMTEIDKRLNAVQWRVAAISGGISLAAFLLGLLVRGLGAMAR